MKRRLALGALSSGLWSAGRAAQSQSHSIRLGWLLSTIQRSASFYAAFERRLGELGHVDGSNLIIDAVNAEGKVERLAPLAHQLVAHKPDVLFVSGPEPPLKALSEATSSIPIVVCAVDFDPEARGYVTSLSRPGRNITGIYVQQIETTAKRVQLLHELAPSARRIAVLTDLFTADQLEAVRKTAQLLQLQLQVLEMRDYPYDFATLLEQVRAERSDAVLVLMSPRVFPAREALAIEMRKRKLPAVYGLTQYVDAGGLASYGASLDAVFVRAAEYVDKIIKGESPSNMPMEQPREFDLAVNLKTARDLGITVPQSILVSATKVID